MNQGFMHDEIKKLTENLYHGMIHEAINDEDVRRCVISHIHCTDHNKVECSDEKCQSLMSEVFDGLEKAVVELCDDGVYKSLIKVLSLGCMTFFHDKIHEVCESRSLH
jgi:hypothetical protein